MKINIVSLIILLKLTSYISLFAQNSPEILPCGTDVYEQKQNAVNPNSLKEKERFEDFYQNYIPSNKKQASLIDTLPVVIHLRKKRCFPLKPLQSTAIVSHFFCSSLL